MVVSPPSYPIYQWVKQAQLLTSEVSWGDLQSRDYSSTKMGTISQNQDRQKRSLRRAWASPYGWWCGQEAQKNSMRHQKWILTSKKRTRSPTLCVFFLNFMAFRIKSLGSIECTCRPFTLELDHLDAGLEMFEVITLWLRWVFLVKFSWYGHHKHFGSWIKQAKQVIYMIQSFAGAMGNKIPGIM